MNHGHVGCYSHSHWTKTLQSSSISARSLNFIANPPLKIKKLERQIAEQKLFFPPSSLFNTEILCFTTQHSRASDRKKLIQEIKQTRTKVCVCEISACFFNVW